MSDDNSDSNRGLVKFNAWWLAAAILVLAVIAALVLVLTFGGRDNPEGGSTPSGAPSTPSQPSENKSTPPETGGVCDLPSGSDIPTVGPDAEWVNRSFLLVPESPTFGPVEREDSSWGCFAHSPTGALFGAANFMGGLQASSDADSFLAFVETATVDNPGRANFIEEQSAAFGTPKEPGRTGQISGFRFDRVEADEVVVRIGLNQGTGSETVTAFISFAMVWDSSASTWLVDVERVPFSPSIGDLVGFTTWDASK